jgi:hypothetical protein
MALEQFHVHLPEERLALLGNRLDTTLWADEAAQTSDWHYGVPGYYLRELCT